MSSAFVALFASSVHAFVAAPRPVSPAARRMSPPRALVIDPSYNLAGGAALLGTLCGGLEDLKDSDGNKLVTAKLFGGAAVVFVLFGAFLAFQTTTLRFTFDDNSFALVKADGASMGENVVVGGENRW